MIGSNRNDLAKIRVSLADVDDGVERCQMHTSSSIRVALILSAVTGVTILSNSFTQPSLAASKNFAAKCEAISGNVKGLAIEPTYSHQQLCACAATNEEFRRQIGAAGI